MIDYSFLNKAAKNGDALIHIPSGSKFLIHPPITHEDDERKMIRVGFFIDGVSLIPVHGVPFADLEIL